MVEEKISELRLDQLALDLENPRFGLIDAASEAEALSILASRADLRELWNSINERGFERYEPLVAFEGGDGRFVVVEGNRRLAAVKTLRDPMSLSGARLIPPPISQQALDTTVTLPVYVVPERDDADNYIGFKHINGPSTWGALAKAKFAVKLFEKSGYPTDGNDSRIQQLSKRLGDSRQLILRSLVAYKVFDQAIKLSLVDEELAADNALQFSHLYTMLQNPATREYLGLTEAPLTESLVINNPVPESHIEQLGNMMQWLFGGRGHEPVIKRQGTDRPKLQKILSSPAATLTLETTGDFEAAAGQAGFATDNWLDSVIRLATLSKAVADGVTELPEDLERQMVERASERLGHTDRHVKGAVAMLRALFP